MIASMSVELNYARVGRDALCYVVCDTVCMLVRFFCDNMK